MRWSGVSYLRIAGAAAAAALIAFLWWRVSLSFSQGDVIDEQRGHIEGLELAAARDRRTAHEIAVFRAQQSDATRAFHDELTKKPLTHQEPPHVDPVTGKVEPCVVRDPARYRELFNQAVTGAAGVP
jgi:hypothetical protein